MNGPITQRNRSFKSAPIAADLRVGLPTKFQFKETRALVDRDLAQVFFGDAQFKFQIARAETGNNAIP